MFSTKLCIIRGLQPASPDPERVQSDQYLAGAHAHGGSHGHHGYSRECGEKPCGADYGQSVVNVSKGNALPQIPDAETTEPHGSHHVVKIVGDQYYVGGSYVYILAGPDGYPEIRGFYCLCISVSVTSSTCVGTKSSGA